jgi:hypothetical protein
MITVKLFSYPNSVEIQIFDPSIFTTRNRQVYSRPIKVYQGVDNPIQVIIKNQDQKPVNMSAYAVHASIQDPTNQVTIRSYPVIWANANIGQANFTFDANTINSLEQRFYKIAFSATTLDTDQTSPLYIDVNYGVPLDLEVLPAYYGTTVAPPTTNTFSVDGGSL